MGESLDSKYSEDCVRLEPGQSLLMFTDGLHDLTNENNQTLSDRALFKLVAATKTRSASFNGFARNLKIALLEYNRIPLKDDFTMVQFEPKHVSISENVS